MKNSSVDLFQPFQLGPYRLTNRIVMAPLTRSRAGSGDVPWSLNAEYYSQRASAGLIVSEATNISQEGKGYAFTPGIYTPEQVKGWKLVTDEIHRAKGLIFCQLWHVGRISHPSLQPNGSLPVAPSALKPAQKAFTESGLQDCVTPRALKTNEIPRLIEDYKKAAECAKEAGFDGVEIHAANGYLLHQFLGEKTNLRLDQYGGNLQNRARLVIEVTKTIVEVWGGDCVGIRFSPVSPANDMNETGPFQIYSYLADQLNPLGLAYVHIIEGATGGDRNIDPNFDFQLLKKKFKTTYMANNGYTLESSLVARENKSADLICFGKPFISNPDLVARFKAKAPLNELRADLLYGGGAEGYTDYPFLKSKDPLLGVTLENMLRQLVDQYGWEGLGKEIHINCFLFEPSLNSSLKFLRRTPWARSQLEDLFKIYLKEKKNS